VRPSRWLSTIEMLAAAVLVIAITAGTLVGSGSFGSFFSLLRDDAAKGSTMYLGNAARTGEQPGPGPEGLPGLRWRTTDAGFNPYGGVVAANGLVYSFAIISLDNPGDPLLVALDAVTGRESWHTPIFGLSGTAPAVVGGLLVVGAGNEMLPSISGTPSVQADSSGALVALDALSGKIRWRFPMDAPVRSAPAIADGMVYAASMDGAVVAVDAADGTERWAFTGAMGSLDTQPWLSDASPAVAGGHVFIGSSAGEIISLDAKTGTEAWRSATDGGIVNTPVVAHDTVFATGVTTDDFGSNPSATRLYAMDASTGKARWTRELQRTAGYGAPGILNTSPAVVDGMVVVAGIGDGSRELRAFDAASGESRWTFAAIGAVESPPSVVDGTIFIGANNATFYALDLASGRERWHVDAAQGIAGPAAVADGAVYFVDTGTTLYALSDTGAGIGTPAATPAPTGDISGLAACDIEPRPVLAIATPAATPSGFDGQVRKLPAFAEGTPEASVVPVTRFQRSGSPPAIDPGHVPTGEPVPDDILVGIRATLTQMIACARPGRERELAAFYSDDFFRRPWVNWNLQYNGYSAWGPEGSDVLTFEDTVLLPDGRPAVLIRYNSIYARFVVFTEQDGRWLIDEWLQVSQGGQEGG
jgi:outer membrane protein assembly factor BamB